MSTHAARLAALRAELARCGIDGFLVPIADEHGSEYVGSYAQRLAWLTGFDGSAGAAAVLAHDAAIFVDGRYTLQAAAQVDAGLFKIVPSLDTPLNDWLAANVRAGTKVGFDPWLYTERQASELKVAVEGRGGSLVPLDENPIDKVWDDRPGRSQAPLEVHPIALAGQSSAEKRQNVAQWLEQEGADVAVVTALDSIAWLFNVRGADVARTPVALAFALVHRDGTADLFIDEEKLTPAVRAHLGNAVRLSSLKTFGDALSNLSQLTVTADPDRMAAAVFHALREAGAKVVARRDPVLLPKAIKNAAEVGGMRAAHLRDGAALCRFLHWVAEEGQSGTIDELGAAAKLEAFRRESGALKDLSFDSIVGSGPNGAIVHYRSTPATNRRVQPGELLLVDSGGQYADGTTDVTRTIAIGAPTAEMRDRFTRVLQGHIAVASAVFPEGAKGCQLDGMARRPLWEAGLDYAHGTGHGVGSYLAVHEGPQRIATYGGGDEPLKAGMILSNEPGYYKPGAYGIRIENLVLIVSRAVEGAEKPMFGFEDLTLAPIDRALVEVSMLRDFERNWLNDYHRRVQEAVSPIVPEEVSAWLVSACAPL